MNSNGKTIPEKSKKHSSTIALYVLGSIVALIGVAALINTINLYNTNVTQYVTQGYASEDVISQLLPSLLLPGLFEAIAVYGGIAILLFFAGMLNEKISYLLVLSMDVPASDNVNDEIVLDEVITIIENEEATNQEETVIALENEEDAKQEEIVKEAQTIDEIK